MTQQRLLGKSRSGLRLHRELLHKMCLMTCFARMWYGLDIQASLFQQVAGFGEYCGGEGSNLLPERGNDNMFTLTQLSSALSLSLSEFGVDFLAEMFDEMPPVCLVL